MDRYDAIVKRCLWLFCPTSQKLTRARQAVMSVAGLKVLGSGLGVEGSGMLLEEWRCRALLLENGDLG